jgi:uncharacterized protein (UPF0305 family)
VVSRKEKAFFKIQCQNKKAVKKVAIFDICKIRQDCRSEARFLISRALKGSVIFFV